VRELQRQPRRPARHLLPPRPARAAAGRLAGRLGRLRHNPVYAARHATLTSRAKDPLTTEQARAAIAAALLRQIHAITTRRVPWDAAVAAGQRRPSQEVTAKAA
jgi:hypothetical protein